MANNTETTEQSTGSFYRQLLTCIGLCSFFFLANYLWNSYTDSQVAGVKSNVKRVSTTSPEVQNNSGVRIKKIQEVEVGERAIGINPELTDSERATFLPDPKPATWRKLTLEMIKPNGKRLDITLLRPLSWLAASQANTGTTIFLDLPEMGAQGFAKVRNIEPCPPIKPGQGNVITGTFHHEAANTIDLYVEDLSKPIGCTDNHPFWSVTQNEFVEAGKLLQGEELQLYNGQTVKVVQILPRPGPEQVHNIEVLNEHVYRVTDAGLLVHNMCAAQKKKKSGQDDSTPFVSRGSTGRTTPKNEIEKVAMAWAKLEPNTGKQLKKVVMNDPRWPVYEGWVKMEITYNNIVTIHYVLNIDTLDVDDFKFKDD
jgi:hypothetical protein